MASQQHEQSSTSSNFQARITAATALLTTVCLLCVESVKSFASQQSFPTVFCSLLQTSSAAAWAARFPSVMKIPSERCFNELKSSLSAKRGAVLQGKFAVRKSPFSSTSLRMAWSVSDFQTFTSSALEQAQSPLRPFGSWYQEVNHYSQPPVYDEDIATDYSFSSPTDNWPTLTNDYEELSSVPESVPPPAKLRRGQRPIRAIRRAATWAFRGGREGPDRRL